MKLDMDRESSRREDGCCVWYWGGGQSPQKNVLEVHGLSVLKQIDTSISVFCWISG